MTTPTQFSPSDLPTGTLTFLFTDVEGSTRLWELYPEEMRVAMARHDELIESYVVQSGGKVVRPRGEGDSRFAVFQYASDAAIAAIAIQRKLFTASWPFSEPLRVRMALHTGEADLREGDYYGSAVNRCARLRGAAHGGQILISQTTQLLITEALPDGADLLDLGEHKLKDLHRSERIYQIIIQGLPADFPPLKTPDSFLTNLPMPRNQLIGRNLEMETISDLLLLQDVALVTLTGAGGTGKSRLGLQIALDLRENFEDGVYLVALESIRDPKLVIPTIAETLGVRESPGSRPISDILKEFLLNKQMLLLLDNFEQVVAAAPSVGDLLEACPRLKILVTSRTPLRLRAEKELPVSPLMVPTLEEYSNRSSLSQYAAVELFIQRAAAIKPDFAVTNANAPAVAEICHRLDGLPLAIELAAARIKLLTPQGILTRLENRFELLRGGTRDLPERQRTLRGTIDWSYNLLNELEKKLFQRLSIFIGGWTLEAAEMVCDIDGDLTQTLYDVLESLIDNSLVIQIQDSEEGPRFGMLSTIHEYGRERLMESQEADTIHYQHAQYYLNFVQKVEPLIRSAERMRWQQVMQQELGNVRGVLEWICRTGKCVEIGQHIVITLGIYWMISGYIAEGQQWCNLITALSDESTPISIRAGLLGVAGEIAWMQGDHSSSKTNLDESLELLHRLDDKTLEDKHILATVTMIRGLLAATSRDYETATTLYQRVIELCEDINDQWLEVITISWLGDIALYKNDSDRAMALYNQSIKLARQQGDPWSLMPSLMSSGQIALVKGDLANARSILNEAEALLRNTGDHWSLSWVLNDLGHIMLMEGKLDQAVSNFVEGITLAKVMGNLRVLVISLAGTAALIAKRLKDLPDAHRQVSAELAIAGRLCGATLPYIDRPGVFSWFDSKLLYDADIAQVQSLLDKDLWDKTSSEGQSMSFEQVIDLALQSLKE